MTFTLLPAIDVADGRDARAAALAWQAGGAEWIHLVDLDAAFGRGSNAELLAAVIGELDVKVELAGGIRGDASLERALSTGCARVNLATAALADPAWCTRAIAAHGERVAVSLDVRVVEDPADRRSTGSPPAAGPPTAATCGRPSSGWTGTAAPATSLPMSAGTACCAAPTWSSTGRSPAPPRPR